METILGVGLIIAVVRQGSPDTDDDSLPETEPLLGISLRSVPVSLGAYRTCSSAL